MNSIKMTIAKDTVSPILRKLQTFGRNPMPATRSMGLAFKNIIEKNFNTAGDRPRSWPAKRDGSTSNLQKTSRLARGFQLEITKDRAVVKNSVPYANIQQYGGIIRPKSANYLSWIGVGGKRIFAHKVVIPPRPFFPVQNGKLLSQSEQKIATTIKSLIQNIIGKTS